MEVKEIIPNLNRTVMYEGGRYRLERGEIFRSTITSRLEYSAKLIDANGNVVHAPLEKVAVIKEGK